MWFNVIESEGTEALDFLTFSASRVSGLPGSQGRRKPAASGLGASLQGTPQYCVSHFLPVESPPHSPTPPPGGLSRRLRADNGLSSWEPSQSFLTSTQPCRRDAVGTAPPRESWGPQEARGQLSSSCLTCTLGAATPTPRGGLAAAWLSTHTRVLSQQEHWRQLGMCAGSPASPGCTRPLHVSTPPGAAWDVQPATPHGSAPIAAVTHAHVLSRSSGGQK